MESENERNQSVEAREAATAEQRRQWEAAVEEERGQRRTAEGLLEDLAGIFSTLSRNTVGGEMDLISALRELGHDIRDKLDEMTVSDENEYHGALLMAMDELLEAVDEVRRCSVPRKSTVYVDQTCKTFLSCLVP